MLIVGLSSGLFFWPIGGFIFGLILGLFGRRIGWQITEYPIRFDSTPNNDFRESIKNELIFGLLDGLASGLFFGLVLGLSVVLSLGLLIGLFFGLVVGWQAVIQHIVLRYFLAREKVIPTRRYDLFLDHCV